jgi:radical SAM protein with 4Fe4S-binding SPASM domain
MILTRFLHEGPYTPEIVEPPDMNDAKPGSLYLHPTYKCNLHCLYCYNKKDRNEFRGSELSTEQWLHVLDQAKDFGINNIIFTGGEPLLRKDIFELAAYTNNLGMASQLLTNALLITADSIDEIVNTFGTVGLSLDSHIRETNDFLRGEGTFDATIRLAKMLEEREKTYTFNAVITKHNVWDVPGLYKFLFQEFGSISVSPSLFIPSSEENLELLPKLEDYLSAITEANEVVDSFLGADKMAVLKFHGIPGRQYQCGAAAGEISIGPDGSVYPCQALQKDEFKGGNVKQMKLKDIFYTSPVLNKVRHCTVDTIETCRDCEIRYLCGGGCRALAYSLYDKIDCFNSYSCDYLKNLSYDMLWRCSCIPLDRIEALHKEQVKSKL